MEKKHIKISLGTFIVSIIAIILIVAVIIMGIQISNQNKALEESKIAIANKKKELQQEKISKNNEQDIPRTKPTSIIISGIEDMIFYPMEKGYEAHRKYIYIPIEDINNYKNKKYYVYIKNKYLGDVVVEPEEGPFEGMVYLNHYLRKQYDQDGIIQILVDAKYDAIPRESEIVDMTANIKNNIKELNDYSDYEIEKIDLDGDGKTEYCAVLSNQNIEASKIMLLNSNGEKIEDLVEVKGRMAGISPVYLNIKDVTYIDLDNDGIMEILVTLPTWEGGPDYTVFKYEGGKIIGNKEEINLNEYP